MGPLPFGVSMVGNRGGDGYRFAAVRAFLTYPQCDYAKEGVLQCAISKWGKELNWIVIAKEAHQDGSPHLHVGICFSAKKDFRSSNWADFLTKKHGSYEAMKSMKKTLEYLLKSDPAPLSHGIDPEAWLAGKTPVSQRVETMLLSGKTLEEILPLAPGYLLKNLRQVEHFAHWAERMRIRNRSPVWDPVHAVEPGVSANVAIASWLNRNILQERHHKQRQLWIHGPANLGKSTLLIWLSDNLRVLWMPKEENYYDLWEDGVYDLVVFDEFRGQKKLTFMNEFLEGVPLCLPFKGGQRMKMQNLPVIICSNGGPVECYSRVDMVWVEPLLARLEVVNVQEFIEIESQ